MHWATLIGGGFCLLALLSILYSTLRTGVPPMPSSARSRQVLLECLDSAIPPHPPITVVDLGSGWGHLAIAMARRYRQHRVEGYELSWLPWVFSRLMKSLLRLDNLTLYRQDFNQADLTHARVLVTYLNPNQMARLQQRFNRPGEPGRTLLSISFAMPGKTAERLWRVNELYNTPVYQYRLGNGTFE